MKENKSGMSVKGVLFIIGAAVSWGIMPMFAKFTIANGSDGLTSAAMRAYIGAVAYIIYGFATGAFKNFKFSRMPFFLLNGFCSITMMYIGYLKSLEYIPAAMASALIYTAPGFVIIFSRIIYKERITAVKAVAVLLTFGGCLLVVKMYDPASVGTNIKGILYALLGGISYSTLTLFGRKGVSGDNPALGSIMPAICGAVMMIPFKPIWKIEIAGTKLLIGFILLGVVGGFLPFLLYLKGMSCGVEGGNASVIATLEPVVTAVASMIIYDEKMEIWQYIGMAIVILGVILPMISIIKRKNQKKLEF
ncbi:MAG: EamA family transporter [Oscillospiraceae bacterium]|nr:EamA family transporter [Oscillospiraceae bacterium]MBQ9938698.1 EamA family transporter [Oscillospiraceae bacterium]